MEGAPGTTAPLTVVEKVVLESRGVPVLVRGSGVAGAVLGLVLREA